MKIFIGLLIIIFLYGLTTLKSQQDATRSYVTRLATERHQREAVAERERQFRFRVARVQSFLDKYSSPLASSSSVLVGTADRFNLDYRLLPAIAGVESTFCKYAPNFNCWGWGRGLTRFTSFNQAIEVIAKGLAQNYDTRDVRYIGYKFCPPTDCNTEAWIKNVQIFEKEVGE